MTIEAAAISLLCKAMGVGKEIIVDLFKDETKDAIKNFAYKLLGGAETEEDLTPAQKYSAYVVGQFCKKESSSLVSKEALSQESVYIEAYSKEHPNKKILDSIEQWSHKEPSGVMLIHGEPGHGKTTLCRKAVYEFYRDRFCKDNTNVFWFRLNPAYCDIITDGKLVLENAFCWGNIPTQRKMIPLDTYENDYRNSILFLDGYDELKVQAQSINIRLSDFIGIAKEYAEEYQMHLVITARTRSIKDELSGLGIPTLQFAPMTEQQQRKWIHARTELQSYEPAFEKLRNSSKEMKELLGIPILFRMVVLAQLENTTANNIVELYDRLFEATMQRRKMRSTDRDDWRARYEQLAYKIYCNDETFANMQGADMQKDFLYMFYLKGEGEQHVEFLHRSFYQYFLAYFLYHKMAAVKNETSAEDFLCCLAERRIDKDVLEYIRQIQENQQKITEKICEQIVDVLEQTDAIIPGGFGRENKNENAEKSRLSRCNNMFVNALSLCCIVASASESKFRVSLHKKENIHQSMRKYDCSNIELEGMDLRDADLSNANLSYANLRCVDLNSARLMGADLNSVDLGNAKLVYADLSDADLSNANLSGVELMNALLIDADLSNANLSGADLSEADLSGADLDDASLSRVDLFDADLRWAKHLKRCDFSNVRYWNDCRVLLRDRDSLRLKDPDAHGIIWCDEEEDSGSIVIVPLSNP